MARMEHERWVAEKLLAGFRPGARDNAAKTSPYLVPWDELDEKVREIDRQAVREIPDLLALGRVRDLPAQKGLGPGRPAVARKDE